MCWYMTQDLPQGSAYALLLAASCANAVQGLTAQSGRAGALRRERLQRCIQLPCVGGRAAAQDVSVRPQPEVGHRCLHEGAASQ